MLLMILFIFGIVHRSRNVPNVCFSTIFLTELPEDSIKLLIVFIGDKLTVP